MDSPFCPNLLREKCQLLRQAAEDHGVQGIKQIPIQQPRQPAGREEGGLGQSRLATVNRLSSEFQPGATGHFHLGAQAQQAIRLDGLHPPEVHRIACPHFLRVASAATDRASRWSRPGA